MCSITNKVKRLAFIVALVVAVAIPTHVSEAGYRHTSMIKCIAGGNGYTSPFNGPWTIEWIAQHFHSFVAGPDSIWDSLWALWTLNSVTGESGPYASSQEVNLAEGYLDSSTSYDARVADTAAHWEYDYAKHYMDSIGADVEGLVVHYADTFVDITNNASKGDGLRRIIDRLDTLAAIRTRFNYQSWQNQLDPTKHPTWPSGYVWLGNGKNANARKAYAYAYVRHFVEDSAASTRGGTHSGRYHHTAYFMDNQYRDAGRLGSYYTINSTAGGGSSGMDWIEQYNIENPDSAVSFFDNSTLKIDSSIHVALDSVCTAHGWPAIRGWANINKFSATHLGVVCRSNAVNGVGLENPIDYTKYSAQWQGWLDMADTMANHLEVAIYWLYTGDILCSATPSAWNYDSTRIYYMHFAHYLSVYGANTYFGPMRFNDSTRWRDIYELDFGTPDAHATKIDSVYSGSAKEYVIRRLFASTNVIDLYRTTSSSSDFVNDSIKVMLGDDYHQIDANGDTAVATVDSVWLKPYAGWIGVRDLGGGAPTIGATPASFLFTATVGEANPPDQVLTVTNTGSGSLNWTATKAQAWLSLSAGSGVDSADVSLSVSIAGKPAGTFTDTVVVTDAAATNTPQKRAVTLEIRANASKQHARRPKK